MELLLNDDVPGLGARGEIVSVARGYARNYLLPQGLAQVPSEQALKTVLAKAEKAKEVDAAVKAERMDEAKTLAEATCRFPVKAGKEGHLYGSVGPRQVLESLVEQGFEVEERQINMEPLKELGEYEVTIALHPEVLVPVKVEIVREEEG